MVQRITITAKQCKGTALTLTKEQAHYLTRVLRLRAGDRFIAQDGKGTQWLAMLKERQVERSASQSSSAILWCAEVIETTQHVITTAPLRLIAAPTKGNSFDQVIRQATELGVTHIYPAIAERSVLKPSNNRRSRWQKIAAEAAEQSERIIIPEIFEPLPFVNCLAQAQLEDTLKDENRALRYLCGARTKNPYLLASLQANFSSENLPSVTLAIGPEGGWTSREISDALRSGYEEVSLGPVILRAVTASITALSLVTAARNLLI